MRHIGLYTKRNGKLNVRYINFIEKLETISFVHVDFIKAHTLLLLFPNSVVKCHRKNVRHRRHHRSCRHRHMWIRLFNLFLIHVACLLHSTSIQHYMIQYPTIVANRSLYKLFWMCSRMSQQNLVVSNFILTKYRHWPKEKKRNHLFKHRAFVCSQVVWAKQESERAGAKRAKERV